MIDWRDEAAYQHLRGEVTGKMLESPFRFTARTILKGLGVNIRKGFKNMTRNLEVVGGNRTNVVLTTNLMPSTLANPNISGNLEWITAAMEWSGLSHLSDYEVDTVIGLALRYLFRFDGEVIRELQLARSTLGLFGPYTALHVRTGFMGMHYRERSHSFKFQHNTSQWLSGYHCAVSAADESLGKSSLIYLASDSNMVKDMALKYYPQRFVSLNNKILHVNLLSKSRMANANDLLHAKDEGILVVWIELFLLAQANTLVRGESGFSWIAGVLCGLDGNKTISVPTSNYKFTS